METVRQSSLFYPPSLIQRLPSDLWSLIFSWDPTYHRHVHHKIQRELHESFSKLLFLFYVSHYSYAIPISYERNCFQVKEYGKIFCIAYDVSPTSVLFYKWNIRKGTLLHLVFHTSHHRRKEWYWNQAFCRFLSSRSKRTQLESFCPPHPFLDDILDEWLH